MIPTPLALDSIEGPNLRLRLVTTDDADFIYKLRTDPILSAHLSEVSGGEEAQRLWIASYKDRESAGQVSSQETTLDE